MSISSLRVVESDFAIGTHHDQIYVWFVFEQRPHSGQVKLGSLIDATARCAGVRSFPEHLGSKAFFARNWRWWRRQAFGHILLGLLARLLVTTEQHPGAKDFKAVAPTGAIDDLRHAVQGFRVAIADGVVTTRG